LVEGPSEIGAEGGVDPLEEKSGDTVPVEGERCQAAGQGRTGTRATHSPEKDVEPTGIGRPRVESEVDRTAGSGGEGGGVEVEAGGNPEIEAGFGELDLVVVGVGDPVIGGGVDGD